MYNDDIISMPDKWEYPWYAAWDLAFHMIPLGMVDPDFAKQQLDLMLRNDYLHPNGQLPAYEWNFGDVNPPVHAWATMQLYLIDKERRGGSGDIEFLKYAFSKLLVNFTWWVNRKDRTGANVFEGGFLGLDNIGVFDRSSPLPTGGYLDQADGTAWMVFFSQQMLRIAVELALHEPLYEEFVEKFFQHTLFIAGAMDRVGDRHDEMWDEEDGFFYDVLRLPDGSATRLKVRSIVGLLPLAAVAVFEEDILAKLPKFRERARLFNARHPELAANMHLPAAARRGQPPHAVHRRRDKLRRILARMLDEAEFFGPHGIRALSRFHLEHPYVFHHAGQEHRVAYVPGDSDTGHVRRQLQLARAGVDADQLPALHRAAAPVRLLRRGLQGRVPDRLRADDDLARGGEGTGRAPEPHLPARRRPAAGRCYGARTKFHDDPHWRDLVLFHEYFHGDTGAGIGASHQTGWTGCVARDHPDQCRADEGAAARAGRESAAALRGGCVEPRERAASQESASPHEGASMKSYYAHMNLPEPVVPAVQTLDAAQGPDRAGHRRQLRHRPRHRASRWARRAPTWSSTTCAKPEDAEAVAEEIRSAGGAP